MFLHSEGERMNVIVIDDDRSTRDQLTEVLEKEGYHVLTANGGLEGLALIERYPPDLILCDELLPDLRGHQICARLQDRPNLALIPFILLSGESFEIVPGSSNVVLFLRKPVNADDLRNTLDDVLGRPYS